MDIAVFLALAVAAAMFGAGFLFGRGGNGEVVQLQQELYDKDNQLAESQAEHRRDVNHLNTVVEDLQTVRAERDQRDAFIAHMRSDRAFELWQQSSAGGEPQPASAAEIQDWLQCGLGLVEGRDFAVQPNIGSDRPPDFVRFHQGFAWVIETRNLRASQVLQRRLAEIVGADSALLTNSINGHTNLGHMVVVSSPEATAKGILPAGYEQHETLFLAVHDFNGFMAADYAMRTLSTRLAGVGLSIDPYQIEVRANDVIRQGQSQIRAGQQLVMLGESIRETLIGNISLRALEIDELGQSGNGIIHLDHMHRHSVQGSTTIRMEQALPSYNPMESNPSPLLPSDEEFNLASEITRFSDFPEYLDDDAELDELDDPDKALLDRLDEREAAAFSVVRSSPTPPPSRFARFYPNSETDKGREDPPTWV